MSSLVQPFLNACDKVLLVVGLDLSLEDMIRNILA